MKLVKVLLFVLGLAALVIIGKKFLIAPEVMDQANHSPETLTESVSTIVTGTETQTLATPLPSVSLDTLKPEEKAKIQVLSEIFQSKNDNDPRMDQVLKNLSEPVKAALQKQYLDTKAEMRNERGTIAFLIGRELRDGRGSKADVQFLKNVLMEKPCLSLNDCSKPSNSQSAEEQHLEGIHETTAHYPQLMDLRYLKQSLESGNLSPELRAEVISALEAARNSPNARVAQEAQAILSGLTH